VTTSKAQVRQINQIEIPLNLWEDASQYKILSTGEQGLLFIRRFSGNTIDQMLITHLDTLLNKQWENSIPIPRFAVTVTEQIRNNIAYFLLKDRAEFLLISIQVSDGAYMLTSIKNPLLFNPTELSVSDDVILIGGYYNQRPLVFYYNFKQQKSKILPGLFNEVGELNQIKINDEGSIQVIVCAKNWDQRKSLWIRTYDTDGNLVKTTLLKPDPDKNLIFGKSFDLGNGKEVVLGSYGRYIEYARGIFSAEINLEGEPKITYHNFGDLQRFFGYLKPKHEARVMERNERRKLKGKKLRYNYHYVVNDIIPHRDEFILLGEVFYPRYTYSSMGNSSFSGNSYMRSQPIFDGYQYSHAIVAGFDKKGKLLWDNSFKMDHVKTMTLQQFVKILPFENKLDMLYVNDNSLNSKTILETNVIKNTVTTTLYDSNPKNTFTELSKLENWYGDYLFAYGALLIVNPVQQDGTRTTKRVFYISKILCQE